MTSLEQRFSGFAELFGFFFLPSNGIVLIVKIAFFIIHRGLWFLLRTFLKDLIPSWESPGFATNFAPSSQMKFVLPWRAINIGCF
jgi:hypothetical protein